MRIETAVIHRAGGGLMRVMVVRLDTRRRARFVRALAAAGFSRWRIMAVARISDKGLARALEAPQAASIWGDALAARIATEMGHLIGANGQQATRAGEAA